MSNIYLHYWERHSYSLHSLLKKITSHFKNNLMLKEKEALHIFIERVRQKLGDHLVSIKLFGSKARGADSPLSDVDVAVIVDRENLNLEDAVLDIAFDINLDFDLYISPKIIPVEIFEHPVWRLSPFLKNIQKEGVDFWTRS